ncbi:MAG: hypothetical protein ABI777_09440 [Betaproteobacteria bacterium]
MSTRWILAGLFAFAVAVVLGMALALVAPVAPLSLLGAITMAMGVAGMIVHAQLLQDRDPHAWSVVRYRIVSIPAQLHDALQRIRFALRARMA